MKLEKAIKTAKFSTQKQKAGLNILYTAWWLKSIVSKELKIIGITHEQFNVLRILKGKHPAEMCMKDIGSRLIEPNSNVPRIVDRLVAKRFVQRYNASHDKRETVIKLTDDGIAILEVASKKVEGIFTDLVVIGETEASQLNSILENLRQKEQ